MLSGTKGNRELGDSEILVWVQLISSRFLGRSEGLCLAGMTYGRESAGFKADWVVTGGPGPFCEEFHPNSSQTLDLKPTLGTKPDR